MDIHIRRKKFTQKGILGELQSDNGAFSCSTLEHAYEVNGAHYAAKVPYGLYLCQRGIHRLKSHADEFETFEVMGVEGHSGILFHPGNFNQDSEGCFLLGEPSVAGEIEVLNSRATFKKFMALQEGIEQFALMVFDLDFVIVGNA